MRTQLTQQLAMDHGELAELIRPGLSPSQRKVTDGLALANVLVVGDIIVLTFSEKQPPPQSDV